MCMNLPWGAFTQPLNRPFASPGRLFNDFFDVFNSRRQIDKDNELKWAYGQHQHRAKQDEVLKRMLKMCTEMRQFQTDKAGNRKVQEGLIPFQVKCQNHGPSHQSLV